MAATPGSPTDAPAPRAAAALADGALSPWAWNRHFWATSGVRPTPATAAGDVHIHNDPTLRPEDYALLLQPGDDGGAAPAPVVYVGTVALPAFARDVLPAVARPFVLCTGMSDPGPARVLGSPAAAGALAAHPAVRAWWAEMRDFGCGAGGGGGGDGGCGGGGAGSGDGSAADTASSSLPPSGLPTSTPSPAPPCESCAVCTRVAALPLGVDFHTLAYKPHDRPQWGPPAPPAQQWGDLTAAAAAAPPPGARDPRVYVHFGWFTKERRAVMKLVRGAPPGTFRVDDDRHVPRGELWRRMAGHRWVLCLQGGGVDCHRTWEALGLGCGVVGEDLPFLRELLTPWAGGREGGWRGDLGGGATAGASGAGHKRPRGGLGKPGVDGAGAGPGVGDGPGEGAPAPSPEACEPTVAAGAPASTVDASDAAGLPASGAGATPRPHTAAAAHKPPHTPEPEWTASLPTATLRFRRDVPVAVVLGPPGGDVLASDLGLRADAKAWWRGLSPARLEPAWAAYAAARARVEAAAARAPPDAVAGRPPTVLLPAVLSAAHWQERIAASTMAR